MAETVTDPAGAPTVSEESALECPNEENTESELHSTLGEVGFLTCDEWMWSMIHAKFSSVANQSTDARAQEFYS